jgi:hypothetical protein
MDLPAPVPTGTIAIAAGAGKALVNAPPRVVAARARTVSTSLIWEWRLLLWQRRAPDLEIPWPPERLVARTQTITRPISHPIHLIRGTQYRRVTIARPAIWSRSLLHCAWPQRCSVPMIRISLSVLMSPSALPGTGSPS